MRVDEVPETKCFKKRRGPMKGVLREIPMENRRLRNESPFLPWFCVEWRARGAYEAGCADISLRAFHGISIRILTW